ncbi:MAG TPA: family 1 glycosylhydrolase [Candidatus Binataceae bacterium]|nr:family 1 glycosylhydrolase [Candidatus Binataceae bacterium]
MTFPKFAWGCGEEASDPLVAHQGKVVRVDELALSRHLEHQNSDLAAVAAMGIRVWRYGMPWRLVEREPGVYDWSLWDRALAACERHGLQPVVDLCHFGLPDHYPGFCDPAWVAGFIRYVEAFLARYRSPLWFTPVNEPFITALNSGLLGTWNDRRQSRTDFANALCHCVLANLEANARIRADRNGWWIGAEGFGCVVAANAESAEDAERIEATAWSVWDLHFGRPLSRYVEADFMHVNDNVRRRIEGLATTAHTIAGHDFYPIGVIAVGESAHDWSIDRRIDAYESCARRWHQRYGVDFWVSETSNLSLSADRQEAWLSALAARLKKMRDDGLPVRGLCWYSRGDQYDWDSGLTNPVGQVTEVGLFTADRRPRPSAALMKRLATEGG